VHAVNRALGSTTVTVLSESATTLSTECNRFVDQALTILETRTTCTCALGPRGPRGQNAVYRARVDVKLASGLECGAYGIGTTANNTTGALLEASATGLSARSPGTPLAHLAGDRARAGVAYLLACQ